jgi:hypothetical protein
VLHVAICHQVLHVAICHPVLHVAICHPVLHVVVQWSIIEHYFKKLKKKHTWRNACWWSVELKRDTGVQILKSCVIFVPCIIRRSRNNQHYALICTTALFYTLAPTCFGSSLPSSGSNSEGSQKLPDDGRLLPKHVGASI